MSWWVYELISLGVYEFCELWINLLQSYEISGNEQSPFLGIYLAATFLPNFEYCASDTMQVLLHARKQWWLPLRTTFPCTTNSIQHMVRGQIATKKLLSFEGVRGVNTFLLKEWRSERSERSEDLSFKGVKEWEEWEEWRQMKEGKRK